MDDTAPRWFKSSYSRHASTCLEVAFDVGAVPAQGRLRVLLRDSVTPTAGVLVTEPLVWSAFVVSAGLRGGEH
jgi:hypothetical protein